MISEARRIIRAQKAALRENDLPRFSELDRQFHLTFYDAVDAASLWHLVSTRSGHIDRLRSLNLPNPGKAANIIDLHEKIADAVEAGDADAAQRYVREHLSGTLSSVEEIKARHPEYF